MIALNPEWILLTVPLIGALQLPQVSAQVCLPQPIVLNYFALSQEKYPNEYFPSPFFSKLSNIIRSQHFIVITLFSLSLIFSLKQTTTVLTYCRQFLSHGTIDDNPLSMFLFFYRLFLPLNKKGINLIFVNGKAYFSKASLHSASIFRVFRNIY